MGTGWLSHVGEWATQGLWRASWQGALCAALVFALTRAWPRMPASLRAGLWWLVALKFVVSLGWLKPVPLPLLPAPQSAALHIKEGPPAEPVRGPERAVVHIKEGTAPQVGPHRESVHLPSGGAVLVPPVLAPERHVDAVPARELVAAAPAATTAAQLPWWRGLVLALLAAWAVGVLWQVRGHVRGWAMVRRVRRSARPLAHPVLESDVRTLSHAAGLGRVPGLLVSESVASPLATGLLSPVVVLPAKAVRRLPVEALRMALAHELAHLRRGDLWLGWVPALAEALLFFHPLARRAAREYALAREEACDAEALRLTGAEPADYGELLLAFGVTRAPGTAAALGASAHVHALHRRLSMLEHVEAVPAHPRRLLKVALSALGLAALVPFQVVAQEAASKPAAQAAPAADAKPPAPQATPAPAPQAKSAAAPAPAAQAAPAPTAAAEPRERSSSVPPPAPPAPAVAATPAAPPTPRVGAVPPVPPVPRAGWVPPVPPMPRLAAIPPMPRMPHLGAVPPVPPVPPVARAHGNDDAYVLLADGMATMSGSMVDLNLARMFQQKDAQLLYVRRNGEAFIIRDPATLKAVKAALASTRELGKAQGELGGKQGELGQKQGELGQKQGELGLKQGELGLKQAELAHKRAGLHLEERRLESLPEAEQERRRAELEKQEQALDKEMDALEKQMEALGEQMEALGREQEKLGEQQEKLGAEQEKLGEQHEKLVHEAEKKVDSLIDEALKKGLGQPLPT